MKTRFIDFEGIHGSGKSSTAWVLHNNLYKKGINSTASFEAYVDEPRENLLDFSFMSVLIPSELEKIINKFPEQGDMLLNVSKRFGDYFFIYYPLFKDNVTLHNTLSRYEAYGGRFSYNEFKNLMICRFSYFLEKAITDDLFYVCESVLFQQTINELLRFTESSMSLIQEFINDLIKILIPLNPVIFYLRPDDIKATMDKVALERLSDNYDL